MNSTLVSTVPAWPVFALMGAAALIAVWDWVLASRQATAGRWMTKAAVPALLVIAVALNSVQQGKPSWSAVIATGALALCLLGDLLLLEERRYVTGGLAFAGAHLLFIAALLLDAQSEGWPAGPGVFIAIGLVGVGSFSVAWRVVTSAPSARMAWMTGSYLALLSVLVIVAGVDTAAPGGWLALIGAVAFYASDILLTWRHNVLRDRGDNAPVMITYHVALFALAGWALMA